MSNKVKHQLPLVDGVACEMSLEAINKLSEDPDIEYISFDSKVFALLDIANESISSSFPHQEGYTGEGITVAVIDTGVAPHNDLTRPTNRIVGFKDFVNDRSKPYDDNGHGTHVAGIIASSGYSSNGKYTGVAPKANILGIKALDESGSGSTSDIISAIQWVIDTKDVYNTKVLNLSLGSPANEPYYSDPLAKAAEAANDAGITVVVAAGNSGPSKNTILSPGISPSVITVGAIDDNKTPEISDDTIADFSSRGPTNDGLKKPDLVAPGVDIMSLSNNKLDGYTSLSGTSMATPLVAGTAALMYQKNSNLTPKAIKSSLKNSCTSIEENYDEQGSGVLNLKKLFESPIKETPINEEEKTVSKGLFGDGFIVVVLIVILLLSRYF
ncbi:intracellular alkaline serine proteinase [Caldisalinibacter kiritimatiensis]|uniref:Intracellular alkaline serine proteinase n=2 Tax=Caldisalinibacter kiritimatiensis TaxID=1304284 RepID=R1CN93_9FIRM|nr:intracellular alkaline serine proteinase [Caldisalinibacter kiritimatiensis]